MFRLKSIYLSRYKVFKDFSVDFIDSKDQHGTGLPYFSLVIGPNGTGKSLLLRVIVDIFRAAYSAKNSISYSPNLNGLYSLKYELDGIEYELMNFLADKNSPLHGFEVVPGPNSIRFKKQDVSITSDDLMLPSKIIANSIMITDRFPVLKEETFPIYTYLGVRRSPSVAGTRTYVRKTIELLTDSIDNEVFRTNLKRLLDFLEFTHSLYVSYIPRYKSKFFNGNLSSEFINEFFQNFTQHTRRDESNKPWGYEYYQSIKDNSELVEKIASFCNQIAGRLEPVSTGSRTSYFGYDVLSSTTLKEEFELIRHLDRLDLISFPSITLEKKKETFELEDSSSGEYHFFSTVVGLLASIKDSSVVLIDEPEISLHPNWQMKYFEFLNEIFKSFSSCHFIATTHSHFLVSDLKAENSTMISFNKEQGNVIAQQIPYETFGWSAEEVLYSVFKVRSSRNSYLEYDLTKLITLINRNSGQPEDIESIKEILLKIRPLVLSEADPLKIIREKAEIYLANKNA